MVVVLKVLPGQGIDIPLWALIVLMTVLGACFYTTYWLGKRALNKTPSVSLEALIGAKGKTTTILDSRGYVRIGSELWQAKTEAESDINGGVDVTVVGIEGMTLLVRPTSGSPTSKKI